MYVWFYLETQSSKLDVRIFIWKIIKQSYNSDIVVLNPLN